MKKLIALMISLAMLVSICALPAYAADVTAAKDVFDIYEHQVVETIDVDDTSYVLHYSYDESNHKVTEIYNKNTGTTNVLVYDEDASVFTLDGEIIATVNTSVRHTPAMLDATGWELLTTYSHEITWVEAATVIVVASIVAGLLTVSGGAAAVIGVMGAGVLAGIISISVGATIDGSLYQMMSGVYITQKDIWTFTIPSGQVYGEYTTYRGV